MEKTYNDGEVIMTEGDNYSEAYEILSGKVKVVWSGRDKEAVLDILHEGEIFGEMGLFNVKSHSITIKAAGCVRVLVISHEMFLERVSVEPEFALRVIRQMAERICRLDIMLNTLMGILNYVQVQNVEQKENTQAQTEQLRQTLNNKLQY